MITRERDVAEPRRESGLSKALNAAWVRPFLFLIFIVVAWDLTIRVFRIPAYQIPAPGDVVAVLWTDWPELLRQAWPTTYATLCGFLLSALFGIPVAMLIAESQDGGKLRLSAAGILADRCRRSRSRRCSWCGSASASSRR